MAPSLRHAFGRLRGATQAAFAAGLLFALLGGIGAACRCSAPTTPVRSTSSRRWRACSACNTVMLLVWLVFMVFHPGSSAVGLLGSLVLRLDGG
ncbi:MAG: hypothetical protein U1E38_04810 [Rhodospirillales bacterium]